MGVGVADIERAIRWYREGARSGLLILTSLSSIAEPEELGNGGRVKWVSGRPGC